MAFNDYRDIIRQMEREMQQLYLCTDRRPYRP